MPFPTIEAVRKAVEYQIRQESASGSWWTGLLDDDREIEFRPKEDGRIDVTLHSEDDDTETTYRFRIVVQPIV
jgi:hypothetical protein